MRLTEFLAKPAGDGEKFFLSVHDGTMDEDESEVYVLTKEDLMQLLGQVNWVKDQQPS